MRSLNMFLAAVVCGSSAGLAMAHDEISAMSNGQGRLVPVIELDPPMRLDQAFPGFQGIGGAPMGVTTLLADEPELGYYVLPATANIVYVLTHTDSGLKMYKDGAVLMNVGDAYPLGNPYFHIHPTWTIEGPTLGLEYELRGFFRDLRGGLADSVEFSIMFAPFFAPGCLGDADRDTSVAFGDITSVLVNFGVTSTPGTSAPGDSDNNGIVNFSDVTTVLTNFGNACQ